MTQLRVPTGRDRPVVWSLLSLLPAQRWATPTIVVLGVCAALAESFGLSLFIPLLGGTEVASGTPGGWLPQRLFSLFDGVSQDQRTAVIAACILAAILLRALLTYANATLLAWLDTRVGHRLRSALFAQLLAVSYAYVERAGFAKLLNTLGSETWRTSAALGVTVNLITSACTIVVYAILLVALSPAMTVGVGLAMMLLSLIVRRMTSQMGVRGRAVTRANGVLSERMVEGITGMSVIRTFNRERHEQQRFDEASRGVSAVLMRVAMLSGAVAPVHEVLSAVLLVGVIVVGLGTPGNLPLLVVFVFALYRVQPRLNQLESARTELRALRGAVDDVTGVLDPDKPFLSNGTVVPGPLRSGIHFRDVTFRYVVGDVAALEGVSFELPANATTAVLGPSGAGKSTVIKLLLRLYEPDAGEITIDGRPLRTVQLQKWRERIALVAQDLHLFNGSVHDNIAYGRPDATVDDVRQAARLANADAFIIQLADGYATPIGDRGVRLSGGQRQRLALARAIIRDPEILVLDEATNALDSRSERLIQNALEQFATQRTVIVVAHRFSTIEMADHVVVLDGGRVSEQGDRQALLRSGGLFHELNALQHDDESVSHT